MGNCCNKNGKTYLLQQQVVGVPTATAVTLAFELEHYFCGGRKICVNDAYPVQASLNFTVGTPVSVGNNAYSVPIIITGNVTYMPFVNNNGCGCGCQPVCPITEGLWCVASMYVTSATGVPTVTIAAPTSVIATPANVQTCCTVTNACDIETAVNVTITPPATAAA